MTSNTWCKEHFKINKYIFFLKLINCTQVPPLCCILRADFNSGLTNRLKTTDCKTDPISCLKAYNGALILNESIGHRPYAHIQFRVEVNPKVYALQGFFGELESSAS